MRGLDQHGVSRIQNFGKLDRRAHGVLVPIDLLEAGFTRGIRQIA